MIYGMWLSATGVITSAYRQDVIANNLANSETTGFKRDLATFAQRLPADQQDPMLASYGSKIFDNIGGGTFASPSAIDNTEGVLQSTGNQLDNAISGPGYFTVQDPTGQKTLLTRDGQFRMDRSGNLTLSSAKYNPVLDTTGRPIKIDPTQPFQISSTGQVVQNDQAIAQIAVVNPANPALLKKEGGNLISYPDPKGLAASSSPIQNGFLEGSNVDPAVELSALMDTQRQLEANANMIRYQDETLGELVNTVGKVS